MSKRKETIPVGPSEHNKRSRHSDNSQNESHCNADTEDTAQTGIIESILLKNFMCHSNLGPFRFGTNVNFITGTNGSGKSAILTALILGLGGKSAFTNRGSSIKDFVQVGQTSADIFITLRNRGQDAFKHEIYGDSIVVHHNLTTDGKRSYKLKSATGALVSSKKEELTAILDQFNIQVDNPVSVLTQEMSKHFLQTQNEGDKYKFFMKATQLGQLREDYNTIMETKTLTVGKINLGKQNLRQLERECTKMKEKFDTIASMKEKKDKLEGLQNKMAWAVVNESEKQTELLREKLLAEEGDTLKTTKSIEEWQEKVKDAEGRFKGIQEQLEEISRKAVALKPQGITLKSDVQRTKKELNEAEVFYNHHRMKLNRLGRDSKQLHTRIEELRISGDNTFESEKQERVREISLLKEKVSALHKEEVTIIQKIDEFQQVTNQYKEEQYRLGNEKHDLEQKMEQHNRKLREFQDSRTDRLKRFGQNMPDLLAAIDEAARNGQFKKKPVGPLGAYIRLKDPDLVLAIESCLKDLLKAFHCDNLQDEQTLLSIMSSMYTHGRRPQIIVHEFGTEVYNVSQRAVCHPKYPTVLTALEIDNPVVANCLIDMRDIETILLIKSNSEARDVMQKQGPPRNCREAFTKEGDQVFTNCYYSSLYDRARFLTGDLETEISVQEREGRNMVDQLSATQKLICSVDINILQNKDYIDQYYSTKKQKQIEIGTVSARITELENVEEQPSTDIATLESEAQDINNKMGNVKNEVEQANVRMKLLKSSFLNAEEEFDKIKMKIDSVSEEAEPLKEQLSKVDQEVENYKSRKRHYEKKMSEHLKEIHKQKKVLLAKEKDLKVKLSQAEQIFPERMEVTESAKSLDIEIVRLRELINKESKLHGDRDEIIRQYYAANENQKEARSKVKKLELFTKMIDIIMEQRLRFYKKLLRCLTLRCRIYFDVLLSQRSYTWKMVFDHTNETLSITVEPGEGNRAALSDMRSLSGGERSFSTVCFILSLWSIAESAFRCLDEFDVYMDMVNRRISMDMMLKMADSQRFRQFILLTPQSMSSLPDSNLIRILRMQDPDRGQTTLPFLPRGEEEDDDNP
uniref:Structural maintenance of chromosomes protein 6 n=1 Tax=Leptobrachium leishanense TaxID=445787 RepID=A0A8C5R417_9ANUR